MQINLTDAQLKQFTFQREAIETPLNKSNFKFFQFLFSYLNETEIRIEELDNVWKIVYKKPKKEFFIYCFLRRLMNYETKSVYYGDKISVFEIDHNNFEFQKHDLIQTNGILEYASSYITEPNIKMEDAMSVEKIFSEKCDKKLHRINNPKIYQDYEGKIFETISQIVLISIEKIFKKDLYQKFILEETAKKAQIFNTEFKSRVEEKFEKLLIKSNLLGIDYIKIMNYMPFQNENCIINFSIVRKGIIMLLEFNINSIERDSIDFSKTISTTLKLEDLEIFLIKLQNSMIYQNTIKDDFEKGKEKMKSKYPFQVSASLRDKLLESFIEEQNINPHLRNIREEQEAKKINFEKMVALIKKT